MISFMAWLRVMISDAQPSSTSIEPDTLSAFSTECAALRGNHGIRDRPVGRNDDHPQAWRTCLQLLQEPDPVHLVHPEVGYDQVGAEPVQGRQRLVRRLHRVDLVALGAQAYGQQSQQAWIVIDEQDFADWIGILGGHAI
jgi:hypothetical protein